LGAIETNYKMSKVILVTGATGKQGGAVVDSILSSPDAKSFTLLGVTRNAESGSAKKLAERGVKIVQGDLNDVPAIFESAKKLTSEPIFGVFSVQVSEITGSPLRAFTIRPSLFSMRSIS
jgi:FlaA1/EpsC-like NDP-sugar epimerase